MTLLGVNFTVAVEFTVNNIVTFSVTVPPKSF